MVGYIQVKECISCLALALLFCAPAHAQQQVDKQRRTSEQGRNEYGVERAPDLAQENLGGWRPLQFRFEACWSRTKG
jgi:hypothetical protein